MPKMQCPAARSVVVLQRRSALEKSMLENVTSIAPDLEDARPQPQPKSRLKEAPGQ